MNESRGLADQDQRLIHALQVAPRASWSAIAAALDVNAVTAARRWHRLHADGAAWVSCYPGPALLAGGCLAIIEIDCVNGRLLDVGRALSDLPFVVTVEHVTGGRDLIVTVMAADLGMLSRWVTLGLGSLPGVTASRTQVVGAVFTEGSRWRLRALGQDRVGRLTDDTPASPDAHTAEFGALDRRIAIALGGEGRASYSGLAELCGVSADTVRRRVRRLFSGRAVQARCEVARPLSEWPVAVTLWAQVRPTDISRVAPLISGMREVRLCVGLTGRHNLLITAWVRSVADAQRFEARLAERLPDLAIGDRAVALWPMKLMGHRLDQEGYRVDTVPVDPWSDIAPAAP